MYMQHIIVKQFLDSLFLPNLCSRTCTSSLVPVFSDEPRVRVHACQIWIITGDPSSPEICRDQICYDRTLSVVNKYVVVLE